LRIAGVIFNRVGGDGHARLLREAMRVALPQIPVLGCIPRAANIALPERHLGLVPAHEAVDVERVIAAAARLVAKTIDLSALQVLARPARPQVLANSGGTIPPLGQRIAIAADDAFAFAYPWLLDSWRAAGAELSFFAPLADEAPAENADAIYLPGGFPELHAGVLAANQNFLGGLRRAAAHGTTIYGECGGYMALGDALVDAEGESHTLAGLLPLATSFAERRLHLGYREATLTETGPLGPAGTRYRGHEFHYSTTQSDTMGRHSDTSPLFSASDAAGHLLPFAGHRRGTVMGSFIHLIDRANT
jgi:cobyrinic acid a,c-diamide synthase